SERFGSSLVIGTHLRGHASVGFRVHRKKVQEIVSVNELDMARMEGLSSKFVWLAKQESHQSQCLAGFSKPQCERFSFSRSERKFGLTCLQNVDALRRLSFHEKNCPFCIGRGEHY